MNKIKVQTPFGLKRKKELKVYKADDSSALSAHLDQLEALKRHMEKHPVTYKKVRGILAHFKSIELTLERIYSLETLSVTELFEIKQFVLLVDKLVMLQDELCFNDLKLIPLRDVITLLDPEDIGINSFYIYDGYSDKLRLIRARMKTLEGEIQSAKKQARDHISKALNIKIRPNDEFTIKKHEELLMAEIEKRDDIVYVSDTMMHRNFKVKVTDHVLEKMQEIDRLRLEEEEESFMVRTMLTKKLYDHLDAFRNNIDIIGQMDILMAKSYFAIAFHMTRPLLGKGLKIDEGIHLKVQDHLHSEGLKFMPITIDVEEGMSCITGANMGGKTICLRLMGQMQTMAQLGLFVPCKRFEFEPRNFVFLSSQDAQSIDKGLSTFGAEMVNVSKVLEKADEKGLILIDELARGTNPKEGYAISKAIINYLKDKASVSVITTHFDGLADEEDVLHLQVRGLKDVDFEDLKINIKGDLETIHSLMDYRLEVIKGPEAVPKDAIRISKLMGVDDEILEDARRILDGEER
ncbi:DNA mismatch repair protein MutS [Acidaminobacter sp. JC074]|uniref:lysine 5,6-aminomutase reactivase ATPase KamC n=1 Tax=Acidaminobacter sp. JC074 TaxID=2530199 RepID=UPI001F10E9C6|nr:DNA mismatch repair protein MutS [Acidaminobacter sp. JC074]MCH4886946.1 DNA mismatch repair protein MutS [Acidaminobacter sp. JC074]